MPGLSINDPVHLTAALVSGASGSGDTIFLRGGIYTVGDISCNVSNVIIKAYPGETPILKPVSGYRALYFGSACHDVVLDGVIVDGTNVVEGIKITDGAYNITIKNSEIRNANGLDSRAQGILISSVSTHGILIENCKIYNCGKSGLDHGIYVSDASATIRLCNIYNNAGHGIHIFGSNDSGVILVEKNFVHNNLDRGIGIYYGTVTVINNVLRENADWNMSIRYNILQALIANNTALGGTIDITTINPDTIIELSNNISLNNTLGFQSGDFSGMLQKIVFRNNLAYGNSVANYQLTNPSEFSQTGNLESPYTPFTDDGGSGYKPASGNIAKGSGVYLSSVLTDYGSNNRGNPPTIGAWE